MKENKIVQYLITGLKALSGDIVTGLVLIIPYFLLGLLSLALNVKIILLLIMLPLMLIVKGFIYNKFWNWK